MSVKVEYENGYPTKRSINEMILIFGMNPKMITYCADYGIEKAGFLFYRNTLKKDMEKFVSFLKWNGIEIKSEKYQGTIQSVWLKKNNHYI